MQMIPPDRSALISALDWPDGVREEFITAVEAARADPQAPQELETLSPDVHRIKAPPLEDCS
jgi:hypothetical protein